MSDDAYSRFEARINYRFGDRRYLETALTHKSYLNEKPSIGRPDNERLEFLGDAVLGLAVGHLLMETYPTGSEGELSRTRAQIVNEQGLADVARAIDLGEWLFLGRGEEGSGGRGKPSLLADTCEAVFAAVYLDGGFVAAMGVARHLFGERVAGLGDAGRLDHKTRLQERVQARRRTQPSYVVTSAAGPDHDKVFEVAVLVSGQELARGIGKSKKEAEQRAAEGAIDWWERTTADDAVPPSAAKADPTSAGGAPLASTQAPASGLPPEVDEGILAG